MNLVLLITAVLRIVPMIMDMIKEGKIKEATQDEVLTAFENEFQRRIDERVARARAAADAVTGGKLPNTGEVDEFDRANKRKGTGTTNG